MSLLQRIVLTLTVSILSFSSAWARIEGVIGAVPLEKNPNLAFVIPDTDNNEIMISRDQFLISYNKNRRSANWVAWKLELSQLGNSGRTNKFSQDAELENYLTQKGESFHAVNPTEYSGSCFDRGHQTPSGDRTDNRINNQVTFLMSNMIPQTPFLNRVIWEHLESYTRSLVQNQSKKVYIIAGPIYDADFGVIGPQNDIPVPSKEFKIIFILNQDQTPTDINQNTPKIAVIMPNVLKDGQIPVAGSPGCSGVGTPDSNNTEDWKQYQTSIEEIETKSGFKFHFLTK